jgi:hypothetical protein
MKHDGKMANTFHVDFLLEVKIVEADTWRQHWAKLKSFFERIFGLAS